LNPGLRGEDNIPPALRPIIARPFIANGQQWSLVRQDTSPWFDSLYNYATNSLEPINLTVTAPEPSTLLFLGNEFPARRRRYTAVVQKQVRHSDARITLGIYGHVVGDEQRTAVQNRSARLVN
jgi:hypothetical protein